MISLSKNNIDSYIGDVIPLCLVGDGIDNKSNVIWRVEGDAATLRGFSGVGEHSFNNGVLISLVEEGIAEVVATFGGDEYRATVHSRLMTHALSEDDLNFYTADMHCHTTDIHEASEFAKHEKSDISDLVDYVKDKDPIDATVITDHADVTNDYDFFRGFFLAEGCNSPIILAGAESEIMYTERDRLNILHRHSGELVSLMSAGYIHCDTYDEFEREISLSPAPIGIFAHPHVVGYSTRGIWNFDFANHNTETMLHIMRGIEMGNGGDNKENLLHEYAYSQALDAGFRVSVTCSSDSHGPIWGYDCLVGKTIIMAKEKSREAFHDAFRHNRFYACESGNVKLRYKVNGKTAPADLAPSDKYDFHIELDYFKDDATTIPATCQVISDYGNVVFETPVNGKVLEFTVSSDTARYFYLKFIDCLGRKTWSTPVWCSRSFDKPESFDDLIPLDMSSFTATANGKDAYTAINGDPFDSWVSDEHTPTVLIDMGEEKEICALGCYPHVVVRQNRPAGWNTRDESKHIVTRFKVHISSDGKDFREIASVTFQALGCEKIVRFDTLNARYVKFEVVGNVGVDSHRPNYANTVTKIGNITIFKSK